jgi:hypothetical protein
MRMIRFTPKEEPMTPVEHRADFAAAAPIRQLSQEV